MDSARPAAPSSYKPTSTGASTAARAATLVVKRAAQQTGSQPCWSPRSEGARGSGTFRECQSLVERIFGLLGFRALPTPVVRGRRPRCRVNFTMQKDLFFESRPSPWRRPLFGEKRSRRDKSSMQRQAGNAPSPGREKAGMGVECRHSADQVSTPSPARPRRRLHAAPTCQARASAWRMSGLVPLPGGGSQNIGRAAFGAQVAFHNAKHNVS